MLLAVAGSWLPIFPFSITRPGPDHFNNQCSFTVPAVIHANCLPIPKADDRYCNQAFAYYRNVGALVMTYGRWSNLG
jgi:hypothetical protein